MEQKEIKILSTEPIKNESEFAELVPSEILKEIQEKDSDDDVKTLYQHRDYTHREIQWVFTES